MPSAIPCTPTWQPSCKTSAASPSSSIPSRITFISSSIWGAPLPSVRQWRMLKSRRPNGSSPVGRSLPGLHGNRDTVPLPFPNQNPKPSVNTSPTNGSTIGEKHFRKNTASFLNAIASCSMNGMCGIDRNLWSPLQGLFDRVYSYPGLRFAPPRAILSRTVGALELFYRVPACEDFLITALILYNFTPYGFCFFNRSVKTLLAGPVSLGVWFD